MIEYIIKRTDGEWFNLNISLYPKVFSSKKYNLKPTQGIGDYCLSFNDKLIEISYEYPGLQFAFKNNFDKNIAKELINEFFKNITQAMGQKGEILQLS